MRDASNREDLTYPVSVSDAKNKTGACWKQTPESITRARCESEGETESHAEDSRRDDASRLVRCLETHFVAGVPGHHVRVQDVEPVEHQLHGVLAAAHLEGLLDAHVEKRRCRQPC